MTSLHLKRAVLTALFLLCTGCTTCKSWHNSKICGHCPFYNSSITYYKPVAVETGIGFEVLRTRSGCYYFLNLYSFPIFGQSVVVEATCCEEVCECYVQAGGQRVCLPAFYGEKILEALCQGESVTVKVANYSHTLTPFK